MARPSRSKRRSSRKRRGWSAKRLEHKVAVHTRSVCVTIWLHVKMRLGPWCDHGLMRGLDEIQVYQWARRSLAEQWPEWAPRTRASAVEAITRLVPLLVTRAHWRPHRNQEPSLPVLDRLSLLRQARHSFPRLLLSRSSRRRESPAAGEWRIRRTSRRRTQHHPGGQ